MKPDSASQEKETVIPLPQTNKRISELLFGLENVLRELIVDKLTTSWGPYWYKQALPGGNILDKYKDSRNYERATPWTQYVAHHPVYYLDFPDLATIIERTSNWDAAFKSIFKRKDILVGWLRELEPIRNKVAHNRTSTKRDLEIVEAAFSKLCSYLGQDYLTYLLTCSSSAEGLSQKLASLLGEARSSSTLCLKYEPVTALPEWKTVENAWWFDGDYLGHDVSYVRNHFQLLQEYLDLPRGRGTGHKLEDWVYTKDIESSISRAEATLNAILREISS